MLVHHKPKQTKSGPEKLFGPMKTGHCGPGINRKLLSPRNYACSYFYWDKGQISLPDLLGTKFDPIIFFFSI